MRDQVVGNTPFEIDLAFIKELEVTPEFSDIKRPSGKRNEGLIVADGYDLADKSETDLRHLYLHPTLIGKLYPFLGLHGQEAQQYFSDFPLKLSSNELYTIYIGLKLEGFSKLLHKYREQIDANSQAIPEPWQTVMASLNFQYGDIDLLWPDFWQKLLSQDWQSAIEALRILDAHDKSTREKEVEYIENFAAE
jgi:hypothetical protein